MQTNANFPTFPNVDAPLFHKVEQTTPQVVDNTTYTNLEMAEELKMSRNWFNDWTISRKLQYYDCLKNGYTVLIYEHFAGKNGQSGCTCTHPEWTEKGRQFLISLRQAEIDHLNKITQLSK